jgi:hypothetical protein
VKGAEISASTGLHVSPPPEVVVVDVVAAVVVVDVVAEVVVVDVVAAVVVVVVAPPHRVQFVQVCPALIQVSQPTQVRLHPPSSHPQPVVWVQQAGTLNPYQLHVPQLQFPAAVVVVVPAVVVVDVVADVVVVVVPPPPNIGLLVVANDRRDKVHARDVCR